MLLCHKLSTSISILIFQFCDLNESQRVWETKLPTFQNGTKLNQITILSMYCFTFVFLEPRSKLRSVSLLNSRIVYWQLATPRCATGICSLVCHWK